MRILLTSHALSVRGGSELYVLSLASWLRRQGHVPIVFSPRLGDVAADIRRRAIAVIDDLAMLAEPPDFIHAQHHLPAMAALAKFPLTPAVYVCHGWSPWQESPPRHPAIRRYVAVSDATRERLVSESGVPPDRVRIVPNFVDLEQFQPRPALPAAPRRALVFSNQTNGRDWAEVIRDACDQRGIAVDTAGIGSGRPFERPEEHLPHYDLVFARGRAALEAMAVGAAVVLCDVEGLGPLVTRRNIGLLRSGNFGMQVLTNPHHANLVLREIDRYDAREAAEVSQIVRDVHDLNGVASDLAAVYQDAIDDAARQPHTIEEAHAAHAAYVQWLNRSFPAPQESAESDRTWLLDPAEQAARISLERQAAHDDGTAVRGQLAVVRAELDLIRSGFYFRRVLPPLWRTRLRLIPNGTARFRALMKVRQQIDRLFEPGPKTSAEPSADAAPAAEAAPANEAAPAAAAEPVQLSCVVLDVGGQSSLADAVRSLAAQDPVPEIVVVSSGGGRARDIVASAGVRATVITSAQRLLPGAARNVGVAAGHGTHVAFLAGNSVAQPGWVAGRVDAHATGALVVSNAIANRSRWNPFAIAAHYLLYPLRLPGTPAAMRLNYGASFARSMFARYGVFRGDLRIGEDTEFRERFAAEVPITFRGDVRTDHGDITTLPAFVRDQYVRGQRAARAREILYGPAALHGFPKRAFTRLPHLIRIGVRSTPAREWPQIAWGLPWMPIGAAAYALGARAASRTPAPPPAPAVRKNRLLCLLVFRNERRFLPGFLANIAPHVDGILALDDGSTDGSNDIVAAHPLVRELLRLEPSDPHVWDELRNRRVLVDAAGRHEADWLIALDADERVESRFRERADAEMDRADRNGVLAYSVTVRELWGAPDQYRMDGVWGYKGVVRLFRFRRDHDFNKRALHGQWAPENSRAADGQWAAADLIMYHLRMVSVADRERRKARYLKLDPERRWQPVGYEYLTDEKGLVLESMPPERAYTPLAVEEAARSDAFRQELEPVAVRDA